MISKLLPTAACALPDSSSRLSAAGKQWNDMSSKKKSEFRDKVKEQVHEGVTHSWPQVKKMMKQMHSLVSQ